jgi:hypothetical protein
MLAEIAQSVEQRTENPRVGGSIPPPGIKIPLGEFFCFLDVYRFCDSLPYHRNSLREFLSFFLSFFLWGKLVEKMWRKIKPFIYKLLEFVL